MNGWTKYWLFSGSDIFPREGWRILKIYFNDLESIEFYFQLLNIHTHSARYNPGGLQLLPDSNTNQHPAQTTSLVFSEVSPTLKRPYYYQNWGSKTVNNSIYWAVVNHGSKHFTCILSILKAIFISQIRWQIRQIEINLLALD